MKILLAFLFSFLFYSVSFAECTLAVEVTGPITAGTLDYLERAEKQAETQKCQSIFLRMNSPGGDLQSTRLIVEKILASKLPYLCLITPQGGHAGSAGAIIMLACHVNGGLPATNLGAATPILGNGATLSEDLRKKIVNDTVSWLQGVTKLRGRNLKFAEEIVTEAKSVSIEEAVQLKAVDILAKDELDFLANCRDRKVKIVDGAGEVPVQVHDLSEYKPDLRAKVLSMVADPEIAYLLFMGSLALIYFEVTHPGTIAPGVLGGIGLVLSLVALHKMDVQWGGLALILLGIAFLIAELFVTSFGILGIGGIAALVIGSLFLFDVEATGYSLPLGLILGVAFALGAVFLSVGYLVLRTMRKSKNTEGLAGHRGKVSFVDDGGKSGQIEIAGELWRFQSESPVQVGDMVTVLVRDGLTLKVKK